MRISSMTWSIVSGIHENKLIVIFRNDGIRKNAGTIAKKSFGQFGSAGGHKNMARAEMPLTDITDDTDFQDEKKVARWLIRRVEKRADKK
jgi:nanoRNase/pAp phosphatase (c-di-AMP/oligoRNAs hydrolase)